MANNENSQESSDKPYGLKLLTEGEDAKIDIVAVHGLNGHRDRTWTVDDCNWLRDYLVLDIPNIRVFSWGYDANTHGDTVSCQYLYDHARQLVSDLTRRRQVTKTLKRPIIFIAHSLGGIIVKSALIDSASPKTGPLKVQRDVKISTYGIFFMGTPHQGSPGATAVKGTIGNLVKNIASIFASTTDALYKNLEENSEWLQQQQAQYAPISEDFITCFAYETNKTRTVFGDIEVVPKHSAVILSSRTAQPVAIHADHINMVKFKSRGDADYVGVAERLAIMADDASAAIDLRWQGEDRVDAARDKSDNFFVRFSLAGAYQVQDFVARETELKKMHATLNKKKGRRTVVLQGLGGMGKTQLAIAYAKLQAQADIPVYSGIFWLNVKDQNSAKQSYLNIARQLLQENHLTTGLKNFTPKGSAEQAVVAVREWLDLQQNKGWLMVFDNYDNPKRAGIDDDTSVDIKNFLPQTEHGAVVVTTRSMEVGFGHRIQIKKLQNPKDQLQILANTSGRRADETDPDALALVNKLDGLPLALATAGAYLEQIPATSFAKYLEYWNDSWLDVQELGPRVPSYEDRTLYTTWNLSYKLIKSRNEIAAKLLELWAYFDYQDLWWDFIQTTYPISIIDPKIPEWFKSLTTRELIFNNAVMVLCNYGLIEPANWTRETQVEPGHAVMPRKETVPGGYGMHCCVHSWVVYVLNKPLNNNMLGLALVCVGSQKEKTVSTMGGPEPCKQSTYNAHMTSLDRWTPHATRCFSLVSSTWYNSDGWEDALHNFTSSFVITGQTEAAVQLCRKTLDLEEKRKKEDNPQLIETIENLAGVLMDYSAVNHEPPEIRIPKFRPKIEEAVQLYERALKFHDSISHSENGNSLNIVARLIKAHLHVENVKATEKMAERIIQSDWKEARQEDYKHLRYVEALTYMGIAKEKQESYKEAEGYLSRAMEHLDAIWPEEGEEWSAQTILALGHLYSVSKALGQFAKATRFYNRMYAGIQGNMINGVLLSPNLLPRNPAIDDWKRSNPHSKMDSYPRFQLLNVGTGLRD
ncbi:hypothetical protein BT63DRAFT_412865 [Microthyrium microscopicum]|uniref:NB-ARC domain-containing protein n=1 Tax=Microthyrium microscopicum TaxID=703497 RepID=A0A6A6UEP0_9PEZI|nr:hypothetical protein BT63DRAFT_412865 [Microthyrium microscopicum]